MEVLLDTEHECLVFRDSLALVTPLPRQLDSSLDSFCPGVHGEDHVEAKEFSSILGKSWKDIVVEGATAQGQS